MQHLGQQRARPRATATTTAPPIDYGVKFRSDGAGDVTGFRFYKGSGDTGTHTGNLWDTTGHLLGSATFTGETASGWQQVSLATPIAISANTTYVTSIFSSAGFYPADQAYFASSGVDAAPLHALRTGVDGPNAVYHEGPVDAYPDQSYNASNYWADVVFSDGPDTTAPVITSRTPASNATGVAATTSVTATFNEPMNPATITTATFDLRDASNALVPASVAYDATVADRDAHPDERPLALVVVHGARRCDRHRRHRQRAGCRRRVVVHRRPRRPPTPARADRSSSSRRPATRSAATTARS